MKLHKPFMIAAAAAVMTLGGTAGADGLVEGYPSKWRIQDYQNGAITIWYTGSPCSQGNITLPGSAPAESKARLWSLLLTAIAINKMVGIYYDSGCNIQSFYYKEG